MAARGTIITKCHPTNCIGRRKFQLQPIYGLLVLLSKWQQAMHPEYW